jgi:hypothetical protein
MENDVLIRNLIGTILSNDGYRLLAAANKAEAIELSRNFSGEIRLLIARNRDLAAAIGSERPATRVIELSGATWSELKEIVRKTKPGAFLREAKLPCRLSQSIHRALTHVEFPSGIVEV